MKIIHSFWSKPSLHKRKQDYSNNRRFGGWLKYKYFLMSNCLSALTLKKEHGIIDLYTDNKGFEILIDHLNLPYDDVSMILNELDNEDHRLWILGKIKVIEKQETPFIHVDNDVFTWKPFPKSNHKDYIIVQSKHPVPNSYLKALSEVQEKLNSIPVHLTKDINEYTSIANVGIVGGNNIAFFQDWCQMAKKFLNENINMITHLDTIGNFNQIIEEFSISCLLEERSNVNYLIDSSNEGKVLDSVLRFHLIPFIDNYIHLVGIAKQNKIACNQLELRLKYEFPKYHKKVMEVIDSMGITDNPANPYEIIKSKRISKAIYMAHMYSYNEIKTFKMKFYDNYKITTNEEGDNYYLIEQNPLTKTVISKSKLTGITKLLVYFTEYVTINDLISMMITDFAITKKEEHKMLEKNTISMIFEEILLLGSIEIKAD